MKILSKYPGAAFAILLALSPGAFSDIESATATQVQSGVLKTYERLLPLEGGSNFRDLGGYQTSDGKTVRKGLLFRSGVMTGLTEKDEEYLANFAIDSVVDLRSSDELELYPNNWAQNADIDYMHHDYSMAQMMASTSDQKVQYEAGSFYRHMPYTLKPQLKLYFEQAINGQAPLVVNCSAGQDRTGIASALMLSALGVPRQHIMQDYVLSTEFRRPAVERGSVDLAAAAQTNAFAKMMQRYSATERSKASPLITAEGIPYLYYAFEQIESDHGSVLAYLEKELDVGPQDIARLRAHYLE